MRWHAMSAMCAFAVISGSSPAPAEPSPQGTYQRSGPYQQTVKVSASGAPGVFAGSFSVSTRGCTGSVDATGNADGPGRIVFTKRDETDGTCRITMAFSPDFRSVKVSNDGCLYWHGASCDFEGSLKRVNR